MNENKAEKKAVTDSASKTKTVAQTLNDLHKEHLIRDKDGLDMFIRAKEMYKAVAIPEKEATEYLGGKDPNDYFKDGLIHPSFKKAFGDLLKEDDEEYIIFRESVPYPNLLLFKKRREQVYVILIPKSNTGFEIDVYGEFADSYVNYDIRAIAFTGQGSPAGFTESYFKQRLLLITKNLRQSAEDKGLQNRK